MERFDRKILECLPKFELDDIVRDLVERNVEMINAEGEEAQISYILNAQSNR